MRATQRGTFKPVALPKPQTTVARCYSMIHIGTIPNIYKGVLNGNVEKIFITFELPTLKAVFNEEKGPEPFVLSEELTLSTKDNSNLSKLVAQWRNKPFTPEEQNGFDPTVMVGRTALVSFIHKTKQKFIGQDIGEVTNENTSMKMQSIMKKPKDMAIPDQINPTMVWDWDKIAEEGFDQAKFDKIPKFIQNKMMESEEYKKYGPGLSAETNEQPAQQDTTTVSDDTGEW